MSLYVDPPFSLGQTLGVTKDTDGTEWVGVVKVFPDVDPITGKLRSARLKKCIAVRNSSGSTLYGKRVVEFLTGSYTAVGGYKRDNTLAVAGVADEFLPASGVGDKDVFWVTVDGPTQVAVGQTVAVDNYLHTGYTASTTNATSTAGTGGQALTANQTIAGTLPLNTVIGRVVSGTTGNVSALVSVG